MRDADGEPCLIVIKNGCTTGTIIGRATGIKSFVRQYFLNGSRETPMKWTIIGYDHRPGAFSAIVDGKGRIRHHRHHVRDSFLLALGGAYQDPLPQSPPLPALGLDAAISIYEYIGDAIASASATSSPSATPLMGRRRPLSDYFQILLSLGSSN